MRSFSFLCFLGLWQPVLREVNDAQHYLQTEGLNVHQCAHKITALQTVLEEKREESVDEALSYPNVYVKNLAFLLNLQDELGGSIFLETEVEMPAYRTRTI
jgi:hypothetical protein